VRVHRGRLALATLALATLVGCGTAHSSGARSETPANLVHTWSDAATAGGIPGRIIPSHMAGAEHGFKVNDGDTWWYRIGSAPWKGRFYASADPFYNNGHTSGALKGTPYVDPRVPHC
jgi:hypothetical protein